MGKMSKTAFISHCIQFLLLVTAGLVTGLSVFDSMAMSIYLMGLAVFIANISFYVESRLKGSEPNNDN